MSTKFTQKDRDVIAQACTPFFELVRKRCPSAEEQQVIRKAFDFANEAHKNVRRRSGEPYILHPIAVASIVVSDIGLGYKSITAALLHDVVEDTEYTVDDIRNLFGDKIASLVDGLTKIKTVLDNEDKTKISDFTSESLQAENFKRILLTLNDDVRVVLIKLADRLHNCRTIESMPEHKRDKILSETMFIFIPLAHRLGLYSIKTEMENIWLRFKEPKDYADIMARIDQNVARRDAQIDEFIAPIKSKLEAGGYDFKILKRVKTPYSIWKKMKTKGVSFDQIYDLYAVRIIFNPSSDDPEAERRACYDIYTTVTGLYRFQQNRTRDWIKQPKNNGYEALHCTLMSASGIWIEVQIRSRRMDDIAEKGIAAHWAYKQNGYISETSSVMDRWLAKIKNIISSQDVGAMELLDLIHRDLVTNEIVVFTPKGAQRTIPVGYTALDFAYQIHTHIGNSAIAAKVNMKLTGLSQELHAGDQVEIITAGNGHPKVEWIEFLKSRHARRMVLDYIRENCPEDLPKAEMLSAERAVKPSAQSRQQELVSSNGRLLVLPTGRFIVSSCCNPIPGDPVVGFKLEDGTVIVHKKSCPVAEGLASKFGNRVVIPAWDNREQAFPVSIAIRGIDRVGLLNEITSKISLNMGINMRKLIVGVDSGIFDGTIEMFVSDRELLEEMIENIKKIDGIQNVVRNDI